MISFMFQKPYYIAHHISRLHCCYGNITCAKFLPSSISSQSSSLYSTDPSNPQMHTTKSALAEEEYRWAKMIFLVVICKAIYYEAGLLAQREHMVQVGHVNQISLVIPALRDNFISPS